MRLLKRLVRAALRSLGYDVVPIPTRHLYHINDYADMRFILNSVQNPLIIDVGANEGRTVDRFLCLFPAAAVVAIEANPELAVQLMEKYRKNGQVTVVSNALSDSTGETEFYVSNDAIHGMSSMLPWSPESDHVNRVERRIQVQTVRLDDLCASRNIQRVDVLKLDIQGAEMLALAGAGDLVTRGAITLIFVEVWFEDKDYLGQCHFLNVYEMLKRNGYVLYGLYNTTQHEYRLLNQPLIAADAIFLHRSALSQLDTTLTGVVHSGLWTTLNAVG